MSSTQISFYRSEVLLSISTGMCFFTSILIHPVIFTPSKENTPFFSLLKTRNFLLVLHLYASTSKFCKDHLPSYTRFRVLVGLFIRWISFHVLPLVNILLKVLTFTLLKHSICGLKPSHVQEPRILSSSCFTGKEDAIRVTRFRFCGKEGIHERRGEVCLDFRSVCSKFVRPVPVFPLTKRI